MARIQKRVKYMISADIARRPLLYPLGRQFGVEVNIRAGSMTEEGGVLVLDLVGEDGAVVMNRVLENQDPNFGYDARLDRYVDMVKEGIIDPTKVVRSALQNAASVSTLLLTSDALVAEMPKEEKKGGGGGMDDMY